MRIDHIYRYPVKGLTAEALEEVELAEGQPLPWDRAFALAQGDAPFDPEHPAWIRKRNFMCLAVNARAALLKSTFDPHEGCLTVRFPDGTVARERVLTDAGRTRMAAALTTFLGAEARGVPRFHHVPGHQFGDHNGPVVSLVNLASIADLERHAGAPRHPLRFRANIYFSGAPAGAELDWVGRELAVGGARLRVVERTDRCPATRVNPETAEIDADPVRELKAAYGHIDLGVQTEVVESGRVALGDAVELLPA